MRFLFLRMALFLKRTTRSIQKQRHRDASIFDAWDVAI